jgi:hypothetical protein
MFVKTCLSDAVGSLPVMPSLLPHGLRGRSQVWPDVICTLLSHLISNVLLGGSRGRMVIGFTTTYLISAYLH